jgi:DNA-binding MarR family transcriptional regulator/GNAT superfamily N-acetyltransferase
MSGNLQCVKSHGPHAGWAKDVAAVRRFNRFYTERVGVLSERYLGQRRPLAEARLLFEIGEPGRPLRELRALLGLDSGYLARLLRSLEGQGLVAVTVDPADRRSRLARLTSRGRREVRALDVRSDVFAQELLAQLADAERARLLEAMGTVHRLLRRAAIRVDPVDPGCADARRCLLAYASELRQRFPEGYQASDLVPVDDIRAHGVCFVGREADRPVACGVLRHLDGDTDEIKHLWVDPDARGLGLSRVLLAELEAAARDRGKATVRLDTHRALTEAIALYRSAGYTEVPRYGSNRHAGLWFEKRMTPRTD